MRRIASLAVFSVRANLRMWTTRLGALFGLGVVALGSVLSLHTGRGWQLDQGLSFYGFLVAAVFGLRSGLEQQRESGLFGFLRHNMVTPVTHAAAMLGSVTLMWAVLAAGTFAGLWLLSLGDTGTAAWFTAVWALRAALLMGFVPLIERFMTLRLPFVLPAAAYFLGLIQMTFVVGEAGAMRLFAATDRADPGTLLPLLGQVAVMLPAAALLTLGVAALEQWRIARRRRVVPSGYGGAPPHR